MIRMLHAWIIYLFSLLILGVVEIIRGGVVFESYWVVSNPLEFLNGAFILLGQPLASWDWDWADGCVMSVLFEIVIFEHRYIIINDCFVHRSGFPRKKAFESPKNNT